MPRQAHYLTIVGIGNDGASGLSADARAHVESARVLAGGKRHLDFFPDWQGTKIVIDANLDRLVGELRDCYRREKTVVLASGDPLFHGIGRVLLEAFPRSDLVFLPHVSSVQLAFARIKETWNDACVVSLHGRPIDALLPALEERASKIALFTDAQNHPAAIAELLGQKNLADEYTLWVCENLGGPDERISQWPPRDVQESFAPLNVVILVRKEPISGGSRPPLGSLRLRRGERCADIPLLGIPESVLLNRKEPGGMITKREVRLLSICYLELHAGEVLWDVGAGSGSVAVEAARLSAGLQVHALERSSEAVKRIEANVSMFGLSNIRIVAGEAPEVFAELPDPDAVFVGGSGGRLADIVTAAVARLRKGGRFVMNCITIENFSLGWDCLRKQGLDPAATSVQLAHSRPLGSLHCLDPENVIFILRAVKG